MVWKARSQVDSCCLSVLGVKSVPMVCILKLKSSGVLDNKCLESIKKKRCLGSTKKVRVWYWCGSRWLKRDRAEFNEIPRSGPGPPQIIAIRCMVTLLNNNAEIIAGPLVMIKHYAVA